MVGNAAIPLRKSEACLQDLSGGLWSRERIGRSCTWCLCSNASFPRDRDRDLWREDRLVSHQGLPKQPARQKFSSGGKVPVGEKQLACESAVAALSLSSCTESSAKPLPPPSAVAAPVKTEQELSAATPTTTASLLEVAGLVATSQAAGISFFGASNRCANPLPNSEFQPAVRLPQPKPDGLTVPYAGHSFGRLFARRMAWATRLAGINGQEQRVVSRGGENGTQQAMWEDPEVQALIKTAE